MNKGVKITLIVLGVLIIIGLALTPLINSLKENQGEKYRDSVRMLDIRMLQTAIEQTFQNLSEYPSSLTDNKLATYLYGVTIKDSKDGETINGCTFGFTYEVFERNLLQNNGYRLSTCLESKLNNHKLTSDGGIYENKYEVGNFKKQK